MHRRTRAVSAELSLTGNTRQAAELTYRDSDLWLTGKISHDSMIGFHSESVSLLKASEWALSNLILGLTPEARHAPRHPQRGGGGPAIRVGPALGL